MATPQAKDIFLQALELESSDQRNKYLDDACGDDAELRRRVDALLNAHEHPESYLDRPAVDFRAEETTHHGASSDRDGDVVEASGTMIGDYKLLQEVGHGGFGVVYMAEQQEPVRRTVALKIIKPGMDTREVIARFEAERQALALMDHPNIAKVLEAGATASGRPYFVMELVKGVPITEFCDKNALSTRQRLQLFISVCHAVQHAHQKGVIHRDLKPSNVMITLHDGKPVPKVIDFGISKAISQRLTEKTLFTRYGQMVGTPQYMSPEQAEMSGLDVDTRSDVYSLGVLLYELLTGTTPLEMETLREAGYAEMLRLIQEQEAPKPSTRLSTLNDRLTIICKQRATSEKQLSHAIQGDLDWIVMKALEKDRTRRYETASGLGADIQRHLNDEPVSAGAPSAAYRLNKFVRRYRRQVMVGGLFLGVLLASSVLAWVLFLKASDARDRAFASSKQERIARQEAENLGSELEHQRDNAIQQRDLAEERKQEAVKARAELQRTLYHDRIDLASKHIEEQNYAAAHTILKQCPEELRGWEWYRLDSLGPETHRVRISQTSVDSVALGPKSSICLTYSRDGRVSLVDYEQGSVLWEYASDLPLPIITDISPDERFFVVAPAPDRIAIPSKALVFSRAGDVLWEFPKPANAMICPPTFSPDGKRMFFSVVAGNNPIDLRGHCELRSTDDFNKVIWRRDTDSFTGGDFSSDSNRLILKELRSWSMSAPTTVSCLDSDSGNEIWSRSHPTGSRPVHLPNSDRFISGGPNHDLLIHRVADGELVSRISGRMPDLAWNLQVGPQQVKLLTMGDEGHVGLWDFEKEVIEQVFTVSPQDRHEPMLSPDGSSVVMLSDDGMSLVFQQMSTRDSEFIMAGHGSGVMNVQADHASRQLVSFDKDGVVRHWGLDSGKEQQIQRVDPRRDLFDDAPRAAFSPDVRLAVISRKDEIRVVDLQHKQVIRQLSNEQVSEKHLAFSPDGTRIAAVSDVSLYVWRNSDRAELRIRPTSSHAESVCFTDADHIAVLGKTGSIELHDLKSDKVSLVRPATKGALAKPILSFGDSRHVAVGISDSVEVWQLEPPLKLASLGHQGVIVTSIAIGSDGNRLFVGDSKGQIHLWDLVAQRKCLILDRFSRSAIVVADHHTGIQTLSLSPDQQTLYSGDSEGRIVAWQSRRPTGDLAARQELVKESAAVADRVVHDSANLEEWSQVLARQNDLDIRVREMATEILAVRSDFYSDGEDIAIRQDTSDLLLGQWLATARKADRRLEKLRLQLQQEVDNIQGVDVTGSGASRRASRWMNFANEFATLPAPLHEVELVLNSLIQRYPSSPYYLHLRGCARAARSQWELALEDLRAARENVPRDSNLGSRIGCQIAALALHGGDYPQYERIRGELLDRHGKGEDDSLAWRIAQVCLAQAALEHTELDRIEELVASIDIERLPRDEVTNGWMVKGLLACHRDELSVAMDAFDAGLSAVTGPSNQYLRVTSARYLSNAANKAKDIGRSKKAHGTIVFTSAVVPYVLDDVSSIHPSWEGWVHLQFANRFRLQQPEERHAENAESETSP